MAKATTHQGDKSHPDFPHGTNNGYVNYGCRCSKCRAASSRYQGARIGYQREWRWRTGRNKPMDVHRAEVEAPHGTESRYKRCDCGACRNAASAARRERAWRSSPLTCEACGSVMRGDPARRPSRLCRPCYLLLQGLYGREAGTALSVAELLERHRSAA